MLSRILAALLPPVLLIIGCRNAPTVAGAREAPP